MREIEVKLRADNLDQVKVKLEQAGCVLSAPIHQHDAIYSKKGSTEEWTAGKTGHVVMRLRREKDKAVFNLKQQLTSELDNTEIETLVADPDAIDKILSVLGYAPQVEVKKVRQKGKYKDYEVCLDTVEQLGSFVELEKLTSDDADPEAVKEELLKELESLGLSRSNQETRGYDTQIFQLTHK
jgi:adenylate cyclase, class 2